MSAQDLISSTDIPSGSAGKDIGARLSQPISTNLKEHEHLVSPIRTIQS
jgi:hypothetical protein